MAKRYSRGREPLEDLEQVASIGLLKESRGCNTGVGSFTVDEIAFAPDRTLRAAAVRWTFRCHAGAPALRGNWSFHR